MDLSLPPDLADFVSAKLATGQFSSVNEVAIAAMRQCRDHENSSLAELRESIQLAREQIVRGEGIEINTSEELHAFFEDIKRRGRERIQESHGE
jgi:Arc/MetJ-type ribon-helix-helix transcriptional regulator